MLPVTFIGMPGEPCANRTANMDTLIVLGSSAAFWYSTILLVGGGVGHVYYETAATIIAFDFGG
jgi:cation transport ATPase